MDLWGINRFCKWQTSFVPNSNDVQSYDKKFIDMFDIANMTEHGFDR